MDKEKAIEKLLTRNVEEIVEKDHLKQALLSGKKLRVKLGIDPTGEKMHIGRAVVLWKLREFQELGHKIVLIIGDFTAQIGDPSDKLNKRPFLAKEQIKKNLKNYLPQIGKIIDVKKSEVRYNSEWLSKLNFRETAELAEAFSINQMLRRRAFKERFQKDEDISLREFMYPLMQGYDSVAVKADVELGGSDQLFNLLAGRIIQKHYGQKEQDIMTTGMLAGLDGRKMSTSWGNVINVTDPPDEQFKKIMSMSDTQIINYFMLATDVPEDEIKKYEKDLKSKKVNPKIIKENLAQLIVARYHGEKKAAKVRESLGKLFGEKDLSAEIIPEIAVSSGTIATLIARNSPVVESNSQAWRLIKKGGYEKDGKVIKDPKAKITNADEGKVVRIGKKYFFRIKIK